MPRMVDYGNIDMGCIRFTNGSRSGDLRSAVVRSDRTGWEHHPGRARARAEPTHGEPADPALGEGCGRTDPHPGPARREGHPRGRDPARLRRAHAVPP